MEKEKDKIRHKESQTENMRQDKNQRGREEESYISNNIFLLKPTFYRDKSRRNIRGRAERESVTVRRMMGIALLKKQQYSYVYGF